MGDSPLFFALRAILVSLSLIAKQKSHTRDCECGLCYATSMSTKHAISSWIVF